MFEAYCGWARREIDEIVPAQRTFERALEIVTPATPTCDETRRAELRQLKDRRYRCSDVTRNGSVSCGSSTRRPRTSWCVTRNAVAGKQREVRLEHTKVMDACSRYIVGRSVAEEVNGYAAGLAIADAFHRMTDEHDAVVFEGRTYPRPFVGLPRAISRWPIPPRRSLMDNGVSSSTSTGMLLTPIDSASTLKPARVKDGRGKGRKERHFGAQKTGYAATTQLRRRISCRTRTRRNEDLILTWRELLDRDEQWTDLHNVTEHKGLCGDRETDQPHQRWIELAEEHGVTEMPAWRKRVDPVPTEHGAPAHSIWRHPPEPRVQRTHHPVPHRDRRSRSERQGSHLLGPSRHAEGLLLRSRTAMPTGFPWVHGTEDTAGVR